MFWLTTFFFLVEIVVGYITNSMALVADSFHMLSDIAALVVAYLSVKVSFYFLLVLKYLIEVKIQLLSLHVNPNPIYIYIEKNSMTHSLYASIIFHPNLHTKTHVS